jgi:hypothetical protein
MLRVSKGNTFNEKNLLYNFIIDSIYKYRSDHYGFVSSGHSSSFYITTPYKYKDINLLPLIDYRKILESTGIHFDFLLFDSCLLGTLEGAYEMRKVTDYIIACQDYSPDQGFVSNKFLQLFGQNTTSPENIYKMILTDFIKRNSKEKEKTDGVIIKTKYLDYLVHKLKHEWKLSRKDVEIPKFIVDKASNMYDLYYIFVNNKRFSKQDVNIFKTIFDKIVIDYRQNKAKRNSKRKFNKGLGLVTDPMVDKNFGHVFYYLEIYPLIV